MADFINTIDVLGDDVVIDSIIQRTITEFKDDVLTKVGRYAFYYCTALTNVDLPAVTSIGEDAFGYCTSLISVVLPSATNLGRTAFSWCSHLKILDLPCATSLGVNVVYACYAMIALILRNTSQVCTTANINGGLSTDTCYIYVPRSLYDNYCSATNWSSIVERIRILEDYTVDGTTTGELDETKI